MKRLYTFFHNQSLRTQLAIWFLLIALIPLAWMTFITYQLSKNSLLDQTKKHLNALGYRQLGLMTNYFNEKERSSISLAKEPMTIEALNLLTDAIRNHGVDSAEYKAILTTFNPILSARAETLNYKNLMLVNAEGLVAYSMQTPLIKAGSILNDPSEYSTVFFNIFQKVKSNLKTEISPLTYFASNSQPAIFLATPIFDPGNKFTGVLIFQINNTALYQLIQNYKGLGNTGETLVAADIDNQLIIYSSFFDKEKIPRVYRIDPKSPFGKFALNIIGGNSVSSKVVDYRGEETLVVGKHLSPAANWAIITKVDIDELLSTIDELKYLSWILLLVTAILVTLMASYVAKKITRPILDMTEKTKLMAAGDLSQHIQTPYQDEIGKLGHSFNDMAAQLDHIVKHLDSLVAKRTEEVENKNTQLEETIEELRQTQNRMITQEKLASLGALTAGIAHEIKNPLNFVKNFSELSIDIQKDLLENLEKIKSQLTPEETIEIKELLETLKLNLSKIHEHGKRADSIVYNMLQHSRGVPGEKVPTDINALFDEYVTLAFHGMRAKDTNFNVKIEKNYDPAISNVVVSPQEICRVFLNLLNNAFYAVNQKKLKGDPNYMPLVKVSTENHGESILIKIWDNGVGISPATQAKLFTPFFTTKPTGEGTGLGLSLSYNLVVQGHDGALTVESEEGKFAEFTIKLPI